MEKKITCLELRSSSGELLFTVQLYEKDAEKNESTVPRQDNGRDNGNGNQKGNGQEKPRSSDAMMTDAQKRYIFRLLAEQGYEGDQAYAHLKQDFHIASLSQVTKQEAGNIIERLLGSTKGGKRNGSPVKQSN